MFSQLTLGIHIRDDASFQNFYPGHNSELLTHLQQLVNHPQESFTYLWGAEGSGRSHLLQAICHAFSEQKLPSIYLPLKELGHDSLEILLNLENLALVCVDDIENILGQKTSEEALFYFYNRAREQGIPVVISAAVPPAQLNTVLPDLQSRLAWGLIYQVHALNEEQMLHALQWRAKIRGFEVTAEVGEYLLRHFPRNATALFELLNILDQKSLARKRRLTIPFIKEVLPNFAPFVKDAHERHRE